MLEIRNVWKDYEGKPLLKGLSLEVGQDEIVCLLGESGSGKSTLLRIIAGLESAQAGSIIWNGSDVSAVPTHQRGFGLMFQEYALFPHRTVAQNVAFGLRMQNLPTEAVEQRTRAALETIRMEGFANRQVTELSGGEQQRVALARALAPDPHMLLLDEPLGALDYGLRVQLIQELRRVLHQAQKPAIYVTHDREEAFALADRLLVLHEGVIAQEGSAESLFRQPGSAWLAAFLGLGNLVTGKLVGLDPLYVQTALGSFEARTSEQQLVLGQDCTLLLRPQSAVWGEADPEGKNQIMAKVVDCVFLGEYYRISLLAAGQVITAHSKEALAIDAPVSLSFPLDEVLCLSR